MVFILMAHILGGLGLRLDNVTETNTALAGARPEALRHRRHRPGPRRGGALRVIPGGRGGRGRRRRFVGEVVVFVAGGAFIITAPIGDRAMAVYSVACVMIKIGLSGSAFDLWYGLNNHVRLWT